MNLFLAAFIVAWDQTVAKSTLYCLFTNIWVTLLTTKMEFATHWAFLSSSFHVWCLIFFVVSFFNVFFHKILNILWILLCVVGYNPLIVLCPLSSLQVNMIGTTNLQMMKVLGLLLYIIVTSCSWSIVIPSRSIIKS